MGKELQESGTVPEKEMPNFSVDKIPELQIKKLRGFSCLPI